MEEISMLSDAELIVRLKRMAAEERAATRKFLAHLLEFDRRDLAMDEASTSTYAYCRTELALSEGESYRRIQVIRLAERFPEVLDHIEAGRLSLSSATILAPHINLANKDRLFAEASGRSKREVEFLAAALAPKHEGRDVSRLIAITLEPSNPTSSETQPERPAVSAPPARDRVEPLTERSARLAFTASRDFLSRLDRARALLRHKFPRGEMAEILGEALEALLDLKDPGRKRKSAPQRPVLPDRRRIPQWVKDSVWKRDGGRCAFQGPDGRRCGTQEWLEYDHVTPFALGGVSDQPANIRLLCRAHNQRAAREAFGEPY